MIKENIDRYRIAKGRKAASLSDLSCRPLGGSASPPRPVHDRDLYEEQCIANLYMYSSVAIQSNGSKG